MNKVDVVEIYGVKGHTCIPNQLRVQSKPNGNMY